MLCLSSSLLFVMCHCHIDVVFLLVLRITMFNVRKIPEVTYLHWRWCTPSKTFTSPPPPHLIESNPSNDCLIYCWTFTSISVTYYVWAVVHLACWVIVENVVSYKGLGCRKYVVKCVNFCFKFYFGYDLFWLVRI